MTAHADAATSRDVEIVAGPAELTAAAAEVVVQAAADATRATGRFVVALSGGSTPNALFELLASDAYARRIDWSRVHLFWGDERCVPPDDPASNYRSARERLLDRVPIPERNVHRIHGEDDPPAAAAAYEQELRTTFATPVGPPRTEPGARFDIVLLGMGPDGHTASLFPKTAAVHETERWVIAHRVEAVSMWRITMTPVVLGAAAEIVFLAAGRDKATTLHRVLEGPRQPDVLPSQAIRPVAGRLRWLVDAAAAAQLERR
jgi:6-phosphogluconolactonase